MLLCLGSQLPNGLSMLGPYFGLIVLSETKTGPSATHKGVGTLMNKAHFAAKPQIYFPRLIAMDLQSCF